MISGKHLVGGEWLASEKTFRSEPAHGEPCEFSAGNSALVERAVKLAEEAFPSYGWTTRTERARFLNAIADEIEKLGDEITKVGHEETGLPAARLTGERGRTTGQLRLFATYIEKGDYLDRRHDEALPDRQPAPRPDLKMIQRPIGPVAVFGASNFPLAFSTAGGDTASALAAGCPVVVKGHPAHPGTGELIAQAIDAAIKSCGLHPGVFALVQGDSREVGEALVQHPLIRAVGFTGSLAGGRALFDLCARRADPIPFFGELGSINPQFLMPAAMSARAEAIAEGWAGSLIMGAGQFCTNPGLAIVLDGPDADTFAQTSIDALSKVEAQTMLTEGIAEAYRKGAARIETITDAKQLLGTSCSDRRALPYLFETTTDVWRKHEALGEEVFGPLGVIVRARNIDDMVDLAKDIQGQLTCTLHMDTGDSADAQRLLPVLERKAGRLLVNGFPTGVEVCDSMVHGGPYPATTNFGATSVGTMSIRRFLRPVCYQNFPADLLPEDLKTA